MKLCLTCYRLSPAKAGYCGHCGCSFGGRVCRTKKAHRNPRDAQFCVECGSADLTDPTPYVSLGCFSHLLTWGGAILLLWWLLPHGVGFIGWLYALVGSKLNVSINLVALLNRCFYGLTILIIWYVTLSIVLAILPGDANKQLNRLIFGAFSLMLRLLSEGLGLVFQALRQVLRLVFNSVGGNKL